MSDAQNTANGSGDDTLAGELVLGLLSAERRAEALARAETDPEFAQKVAFWEAKLTPLTEDVEPAAPPARVWTGIEEDLFGAAPAKARWWDSLALWRWLAGGASLAAAASLALFLTVAPQPADTGLVAALQATGAGPAYVVKMDAGANRLQISAVTATTDQQRVPELWLIPADGVPRSLGLIARDGETTVTIPDAMQAMAGADATLAISLEPEGGAPDGKPTGPIIAAGVLKAF